MKRKEKEIKNRDEMERILEEANACRIALSDNLVPYIVPVAFGYENNIIYFHSSPEGKKIEILKKNNNVCFEIDTNIEVVKNLATPCIGTIKYYSVIGFGKASFIVDLEKKKKALDIIVRHYLPGNLFSYSEDSLNKVVVVKIEISIMTGKKSGY